MIPTSAAATLWSPVPRANPDDLPAASTRYNVDRQMRAIRGGCDYYTDEDEDKDKPSRSREILQYALLPVSVLVAWTTAAFIPITAKCLLNHPSELPHCTVWGPRAQGFSHPFTATVLKLGIIGGALAVYSTVQRFVLHPLLSRVCCVSEKKHDPPSWMFGPMFVLKLQALAPVSGMFGLKYGISHWALQLIPSDVYALLHASILVWIVLFTHLFLPSEALGWQEICCCCGMVTGTVITVVDVSGSGVPLFGLLLTLFDCALAGGVVTALRRAMCILNPLGVTAVEVTAFKALIGALCVLPICFLVESPWSAVYEMTHGQLLWLMLSSGFVLIYQCNNTFLTGIASAVTVGVVGGLKTVAGYGITRAVTGSVRSGVLFWVGSCIVLVCGLCYALLQILQPRRAASQRTAAIHHPTTTQHVVATQLMQTNEPLAV